MRIYGLSVEPDLGLEGTTALCLPTIEHMTIKKMEHVGIVVDDLTAAIEFFVELGLEPRGKGQVEGSWVERIIALGGPHSGTPYAFASLLKGPNLLPFGMRNDRLREVLATFPAWFQILPIYPFVSDKKAGAMDVFGDATWLMEERRPMLKFHTDFRAELGTRSSIPVVCIFGYGLKTITRATVEREPNGLCRKVDLDVTPAGDGTIPEDSAVLEGAEIHPVRQYHGTLYVDNDVKMRLKLELTRQAKFAMR